MNNQRRGSRTLGSENSSTTTNNRGTPSSETETLNDDPDNQNSEGGSQADDPNKETKDDASTETEHPDNTGSNSNQYGHSPDEQTEFQKLQQELANERKRRQDASRKITQQGQANKTLEQEIEELKGEITALKSQRTENLEGGNNQSSHSRYSMDKFDDQGDGNADLTPAEEIAMMRNTLSKLSQSHEEIREDIAKNEDRNMYEEDLRHIQEEFNIDREAAVAMQDAFDQGDLPSFTRLYELSSLPKQARESLRKERENRRSAAAVGHPGVQTASYSVSDQGDDDSREKRAREIDKIPNARAKQRAIQEALDEDAGMYPIFQKLLKEAGYTV